MPDLITALRGPVEQLRSKEGLEHVIAAIGAYKRSPMPRPFGQLQEAIRRAKHLGATCQEITVVCKQISEVSHA